MMPGEQVARPDAGDTPAGNAAGRHRRTPHYNAIHMIWPMHYNHTLPDNPRT